MPPNPPARTVDVTFALTGDPKVSSRALRQLHLLSNLDLSILVLGLGNPKESSTLDIPNVTLQYLPRPAGKGPRFFWNVHQQLQTALQNVVSRVYHASDLYTLPAMQRAAMRQQSRLVFDSRELYTHLPATTGRPWVRMFWGMLLHRYIRHADCVYSVSESIAEHLREHFRLDTVHLMHNVPGPQSEIPADSLRTRLRLPSGTSIILHQGSLQRHRGGSMMVEAMHSIKDAVLVFMGGGPLREETRKLARTLNMESIVRFIDPVPPDQLLSVTASADIGLTFLEDSCLNHRYALPNKLFEYLAAGVPVIASDLPEIARIIRQFNVGCVVPSGDANALGTALHHALEHPELRQTWAANTASVQKFFNFETESERFVTPYLRLLGR